MSAVKNPLIHNSKPLKKRYAEVAPLRLSERDSTAVVNSIRFPNKPNDFLKETMRKHRANSNI